MVKRRLVLLLTCLMMVVLSTIALATDYLSMSVTQSAVALPQIKLYTDIYDTDDNKVTDAVDISAFDVLIDGNTAEIESVQPFKNSDEGIGYTFLIDISRSLSEDEFSDIKEMLKDWVQGMNNNDQVAIVTFGEQVDVVQNYTGNLSNTVNAIENLTLTDNSTRFYDGITKALDISKVIDENLPDRRIIYTITDGQDDYVGGVTKDELLASIRETAIPVYALGVFTGDLTEDKEAGLNVLGEIVRTSGGTYHQMGQEAYDDMLFDVQSNIDGCYILTINYDDFEPDGINHDLYVAFEKDGSKIEDTIQILLNNKMKDHIAPTVLGAEVVVDEKDDTEAETDEAVVSHIVTVTYTEDVVGADVTSNYILAYMPTEEDIEAVEDEDLDLVLNQVLEPISIVYEKVGEDIYTASLSFEEIQNGDYMLLVDGIIDASDEANAMVPYETLLNFVVELEEEEVVAKEPTFIEEYGLYLAIAAGLILLLIILIIIVNSKKKNVEEDIVENEAESNSEEYVPVAMHMPNTVNLSETNIEKNLPNVLLHFAIVNHDLEEIVMDRTISDELIIGRSSEADLSFDDDEMSRNHCKIILEDGILVVEDLNATNTTIVNGVPIYERKRLESDDMLLIGQTEIRVTFFLD